MESSGAAYFHIVNAEFSISPVWIFIVVACFSLLYYYVCNRNTLCVCVCSVAETFKAVLSRARTTASKPTNPGDYYCFSVACNFHITNCATRVTAGHEPDFPNSFDTWIKRLEWHCLRLGGKKLYFQLLFSITYILAIFFPNSSLTDCTRKQIWAHSTQSMKLLLV